MRHKPILRELLVVAFFAVLTITLTWPVLPRLDTAVSDFGDPLLVAWILDWVCHALIHQPLSVYDAPVFHPGILPLAYSENLIAVALMVLPLHAAGLPPLAVYNIALLLGLTLSGYAAYLLARMITGSTIGALAGGIFYAYCTFKWDHVPHVHVLFSPWVPLLLLVLLRFWQKASWRRGALLALVLLANGLTNIYFLLFGAAAVLFTVAGLAVLQPRGAKFYLRLAAAGLAGALLLYPFLQPYRTVSKHYHHVRSFEEVRAGSAKWTNWLVPTGISRWYAPVTAARMYEPERQLFPGLAILFLTIIAAAATRREVEQLPAVTESADPRALRLALQLIFFLSMALAWATTVSDRFELKLLGRRILSADSPDLPMMLACGAAIVLYRRQLRAMVERSRFTIGAWAAAIWIVVGLLGSFGANSFLYVFLYRRFEPFQAMRVPARFAIITYAGLAVWGALGVSALLRGRTGWRRHAIGGAVIAVMCLEAMPNVVWVHFGRETPPVYAWLAKTRIEPVVEFPFSGDGVDYRYLLHSTTHRMKLVNGTSGFFPSEWWKMRHADSRDDFEEMLGDFESNGTKLLIVHADFLHPDRESKVTEWLRTNLASGRLAFLQRFDDRVEGDWVFAVTRNLPEWRRHQAPAGPDPAGHLPSENLQRFLEGKATHSDAISIAVESPAQDVAVEGLLHVRGWTLSPHGIRSVTLIFDDDRLRMKAFPMARPEVTARYPWMYYDDRPGFELVIPEHPEALGSYTSLTVEVEDRAGRIRRAPQISFPWK